MEYKRLQTRCLLLIISFSYVVYAGADIPTGKAVTKNVFEDTSVLTKGRLI